MAGRGSGEDRRSGRAMTALPLTVSVPGAAPAAGQRPPGGQHRADTSVGRCAARRHRSRSPLASTPARNGPEPRTEALRPHVAALDPTAHTAHGQSQGRCRLLHREVVVRAAIPTDNAYSGMSRRRRWPCSAGVRRAGVSFAAWSAGGMRRHLRADAGHQPHHHGDDRHAHRRSGASPAAIEAHPPCRPDDAGHDQRLPAKNSDAPLRVAAAEPALSRPEPHQKTSAG